MDTYYSQHGEDFLVNKIFNGKSEGYYVEIGCLDGIEYSNTYFFEKRGWEGACIEAHRDFIGELKKNRPTSHIVHCAVGEADKDNVIFYANKVGSLSTLDKNEEGRWKKNYASDFYGFEEQRVSMRTLTSIFDELKPRIIDFVSLDIEGYEVNALSGLDFSKYKPKLFVIEYKDEIHKSELEKILFKHSYYFLSKIGCNLFYSLNKADEKIVKADYGTIRLIKVGPDGSQRTHEVKLRQPNWLDKVRATMIKLGVGKVWSLLKG
ncbi:MAG TPA: FkbM family methyltransferase, partial [Chryseolinea sp.]|nr:FkbM family methyltransferase [Chryseolinea sp.]